MLRPTSHALVLLSLCLAAACRTVPNAAYCEDNADCDTLEQPEWTCNQTTHACEPPSAGNECENDDECRADAPICGEDGKCRGCADNTECDSAAPICGVNGQCMAGCTESTQCSEATPFCNTGTGACEACEAPRDDALCSMRDTTKPFCGPGGSCVACLDSAQCSEDAPLCGATNACEGCKEHSDCAMYSGVCTAAGACAQETSVVYVKKTGSADTNDCSKNAPCLTITRARDQVLADVANKRFIRILDNENYGGNIALGGLTVAIIGNDNTRITAIDDNQPAIDVNANTDVTLESLIVRSSGDNADGIRCRFDNSTVRLKDVIVQENSNIGVNITDCQLDIERSVITSNAGGGIDIRDAAFSIVNSFIVGNGSNTSNLGGIRILNADPKPLQRLAFNTVALNEAGAVAATTDGVSCSVTSAGAITATSSIIRQGPSSKAAASGNCVWHYSNIEGGGTLGAIATMENGNNYDDCALVDTGNGVLAITAGTPCDNAGEPGTGILVDYANAPRSADTPDMGADEL